MEEKTLEQIALSRIEEAIKVESTSLDLSNLRLTTLPDDVWNLKNLVSLNISDNQIIRLPNNIWDLPNLRKLYISRNPLRVFPQELLKRTDWVELGLRGLGIEKIPSEIWAMEDLINLNLRGNSISELPRDVQNLIKLTSLNLASNRLNTLPSEIGELKRLTSLEVSGNKIYSLPDELWKLPNLRSLNISSTRLHKMPPELWERTNWVSLGISGITENIIQPNLWQMTDLTWLNISYCSIASINRDIGNLTNLTSLYIARNEIANLPAEIGNLTKLTLLDVSSNNLTNLPAEIGKLVNLTKLNASRNQLTSLPVEMGLSTKLKDLSLTHNKFIFFPSEITDLTELINIDISCNEIAELPSEIENLVNLITIRLTNNKITHLPKQIEHLKNLELLDLSRNKINYLPIEVQTLQKLKALNLQGNPLNGMPAEILKYTQDPQGLLESYFAHHKQPLNTAKLILVGQPNVGKTSLVERLLYDHFDEQQLKTEGIVISTLNIENQIQTEDQTSKININIWDFGGQEIMHSTHQFFFTKRSLYLLVLNTRNAEEQNRLEYWLKLIQAYGGNAPTIIVGNHSDEHPLEIDKASLMSKYTNIVNFLETSAATGSGIETLKSIITEQINQLPHIRDVVPENWFNIKKQIEENREKNNFINYDDYIKLCIENDIRQESVQRTLIGFLHDLGVVLYFQEDRRLSDLGILNPQWVTNGVYKILNSHALFHNKGVLTVSMLDEILNLPEYPRGKRLFIVDMMKKFELCYDIEPDKTFLVPDLLPKDEPAELKFNGVPAFEYAYPVLPSSVITRFIVRMNQKIENHFVWRTGVVLKIRENTALVKADIEDRKITVAIDGVEHTRRDALSAIRYQLDEIHASIKGLNPEKYVPVPGAINAKPLKYEYLLKLERDGEEILKVEDGDSLRKVNIAQMLNGVESEYQRKQHGNVINIQGNVTGGTIIAGDEAEVNH